MARNCGSSGMQSLQQALRTAGGSAPASMIIHAVMTRVGAFTEDY